MAEKTEHVDVVEAEEPSQNHWSNEYPEKKAQEKTRHSFVKSKTNKTKLEPSLKWKNLPLNGHQEYVVFSILIHGNSHSLWTFEIN